MKTKVTNQSTEQEGQGETKMDSEIPEEKREDRGIKRRIEESILEKMRHPIFKVSKLEPEKIDEVEGKSGKGASSQKIDSSQLKKQKKIYKF